MVLHRRCLFDAYLASPRFQRFSWIFGDVEKFGAFVGVVLTSGSWLSALVSEGVSPEGILIPLYKQNVFAMCFQPTTPGGGSHIFRQSHCIITVKAGTSLFDEKPCVVSYDWQNVIRAHDSNFLSRILKLNPGFQEASR